MKEHFGSFTRSLRNDRTGTKGRSARKARLGLERFEDRSLPATGFLQGLAFVDANGNHQ